jgi:WD repeat-containing protein 44
VNVGDIITAVGFSPDGKTALAGTLSGSLSLYATENLKAMGQFPIRSKKRSRITGIDIRPLPLNSDVLKLVVTTTDSRVRIYNLRDKSLELKLKAHKNDELPIRASVNDDGRYVICGSEDKGIYIWSLAETNLLPLSDRERDKTIQRPLEYFEANPTKTTCAVLAPRETRILLGQSGDPIYDICNPPPVRLMEREGSIASSTKWNDSESSINGNGNGTSRPQSRRRPKASVDSPELTHTGDKTPRTAHSATFPIDSASSKPSYQSRASHDDGLIIVTASTSGTIRIYRQDCAFRRRKSSDLLLDPSSGRAYLRRALRSSRTSVSGPSGTRPDSINSKGPTAPSVKSMGAQRIDGRLGAGELTVRGKQRAESVSSQPTRDRIERWRADVDGGASSSASLKRAGSVHSAKSTSTTQTNSSPNKKGIIPSSLALTRGQSAPRSNPANQAQTIPIRRRAESLTTMTDDGSANSRKASDDPDSIGISDKAAARVEPRRSSTYNNPLRLQGGQSFMFWNVGQYGQKPEAPQASTSGTDEDAEKGYLGAKVSRASVISRLTDESEEEDDDDERDSQGVALRSKSGKCPRCGGADMRTKESRGWGFGKSKSIVCEGCGLERRDTG